MAEVHRRPRRSKDDVRPLPVRRLEAFIDAAEALLEAWDPVLERGGYPRYLRSFDEFIEDLKLWAGCVDEAADVEVRDVEALDFRDAKAVRKWLAALECAWQDAVAAGDDATRAPGARVLGRAEARSHVLGARQQLLCLMEAGRKGAPVVEEKKEA